jgi:PEP-CTERM motif-containing protein
VLTPVRSAVNSLSTTLGGESGTHLAIHGAQTIDASSGTLINGNEVFDVTSYSENDGDLVTIVGNGHNVVFDFGSPLENVNLKGLVALSGGLTADDVLWNFDSSGKNINLNTNNSSFPTEAFQGIILAPNDVMSMNAANLDGRFWGGGSGDMQIVSRSDDVIVPTVTVPEPSTWVMMMLGFAFLGYIGYHSRRAATAIV